jgi:homospermidine synthase
VDFVTFDNEPELYKIAKHAPGCRVLCRLKVGNGGSQVNLSLKFGADAGQAVPLLLKARAPGLRAEGISFHVGSQCAEYASYPGAFETAAAVVADGRRRGLGVETVDIGGGFREEGIAPAEMGWGTHERRLPPGAHVHPFGPGNQICLARMGVNTRVRLWVPSGEITGMVVRHGEAFTISDHLTVWEGRRPVYRPTVHYAYCPTDAAINSLHELEMRWWDLQPRQRILTEEIVEGRDELSVLLMGHDFTSWWTGSLLDIHESRTLVPGQNATTLQVAASVLGAITWMIHHPRQGVCVPDDLPYEAVLEAALPYLGPTVSAPCDWTPLKNRVDLFAKFGQPAPRPEDVWQFESFLV